MPSARTRGTSTRCHPHRRSKLWRQWCFNRGPLATDQRRNRGSGSVCPSRGPSRLLHGTDRGPCVPQTKQDIAKVMQPLSHAEQNVDVPAPQCQGDIVAVHERHEYVVEAIRTSQLLRKNCGHPSLAAHDPEGVGRHCGRSGCHNNAHAFIVVCQWRRHLSLRRGSAMNADTHFPQFRLTSWLKTGLLSVFLHVTFAFVAPGSQTLAVPARQRTRRAHPVDGEGAVRTIGGTVVSWDLRLRSSRRHPVLQQGTRSTP